MMLFFSDKAEKNGPKVEAKLRKELKLSSPLMYETEVQGQYKPENRIEGIADAAREIFGGDCRPLTSFYFKLQNPFPADLVVSIIKSGLSISLGPLIYSATLPIKISAPVILGEKKLFSSATFSGDPLLAEKINNHKALIKKFNEFVQSEYRIGNDIITVKSYCKIEPQKSGSRLTISTAPKTTWFGMGTSFRPKEFFEILSFMQTIV